MTFSLKLARVNNKRTGEALKKLGVVRPVDVPNTLHDRPILNAIAQLRNRRRRVKMRREEVFREIRKQRDLN